MAEEVDAAGEIERSLLAQLDRLEAALRNPHLLMQKIGTIIHADAQASFRRKRLGELIWDKLYPNQKRPFISIAGALEDFYFGARAPRQNRFSDQPSLDTGARRAIHDSLSSSLVDAQTVEVKATHPFARSAQEGSKKGDSVQPIDRGTKERIRDWIRSKEGPLGRQQEAKRSKLGFLLKLDEYTQQSLPRPFVGVTDESERRIRIAIKAFFRQGGDVKTAESGVV